MKTISIYDYATAKDLFIACRESVKDLRQKNRTLERMKNSELALSSHYSGLPSAKNPDKMSATDMRIDLERKWSDDIETDKKIIGLALSVLWGTSNTDGLYSLLGWQYAEVLTKRYIDLAPWSEISKYLGYSARHCQRLKKIALEYIDANGLEETRQGVGNAT